MRFRTPHHIVHRRPKPHKKLWPTLTKLHRQIGRSDSREIALLEKRSKDPALTLPKLAGMMRRLDQLRARYSSK